MQTTATPPRMSGFYDRPFWEIMKETHWMHLQCCSQCGSWRYPAGPVCPDCLAAEYTWKPVSGGGELLSWVRFHKAYLPEYPVPYNVIAVRLDEGPTIISNLTKEVSSAKNLIGRRVKLKVVAMLDGVALPRFELVN